ncbi:immune inhibitor A domain-containing protein [Nocardioides salsibiostraticola]
MNRSTTGLLSLALAAGLGVSLATSPVTAATPPQGSPSATPGDQSEAQEQAKHDLPNPLEDKRRALRQEAITQVLNGEAKPVKRGKSTVVKISDSRTSPAADKNGKRKQKATREDQYVELNRESTDRIFVVLAEFGNERHPDFPDKDLEADIPGPVTFEGPLRNAIPEPDRSKDNSTVWQPNYDQSHYADLYFGEGDAPGSGGEVESVKQYYERQSSGRYSVDGTVTDWVKVRYNEARYGRSSDDPSNGDDPKVCAGSVCSNTWNLVGDAVDQWVKGQRTQGRTEAEIKEELKTFDEWDRYDADGDGNFNEPDGYIDHFQVVHAGGDEADGDDQQGEDAIWSHRWYVQTTPIGTGGPANNPLGGTEIGSTGLWVGDYTMQPENGGMSVFAHEYGHDLGLPDLYDTAGGSNGVNFWSMMAQSRESGPNDEAIGTRGADFGAWEKLQLGWLDYETVLPSQNRTLELGPHEYNSDKAQAVAVVLPKKTQTTDLVPPFAGEKSWWSGTGDDLANTMSRQINLPAGEATLSMQANYDIEAGYDYAYVEVNDGNGWVTIPGSITGETNNGIDGTTEGWVPATFDLSPYAGTTIGLRLRYQTDGAVAGDDPAKADGFFADAITVTAGGQEILSSDAEAAPEGWALNDFSSTADAFTQEYDNYYLASHRDYVSFDKYLETGPYNFGDPAKPDFVEHFPYQDGLLISYWDTTQTDNNTSQHPGQGLILPIDANPRPIVRLDGELWRPRVAGYDAPFSTEKSDSFSLDVNGKPSYIRGQKAQKLFRDSDQYWYETQPSAGVKVPNNGVDIKVQKTKGTSMTIKVSERR